MSTKQYTAKELKKTEKNLQKGFRKRRITRQIRISEKYHKKLKVAAKEEKRTISKYVDSILKDHFEGFKPPHSKHNDKKCSDCRSGIEHILCEEVFSSKQ